MKNKWITLEADGAPKARHETSFVECLGKFYLIGGREAEGRIDCFDPESNCWSEMKAKSPLIHHFQPVVYKDKIIMAGAMTGHYPDEPPMEHIYIYDPLEDVWSEGSAIPKARRRGSSGVVLYKNKIYFAAGITSGHTSGTNSWFDSYDPKTDSWEILPDAPHARDHFHGVVSHNGLIIYFGGENATIASDKCWQFDPKTLKWSEMPSLNQGRHGTQAILFNDKIWVACGSPVRGGGNLTSLEVLPL